MNAGQTLPLAAVTLVLGGARSGKSAFGQNLVQNAAKSPVLIATARVADDEMADRIERHKTARGPEWRTIEEDIDLAGALLTAGGGAGGRAEKGGAVLVDCLTLWLANVMEDGLAPVEKIQALLDALPSLDGAVVFISNEVGLGIVPANPLAREFRDLAGHMNQSFATAANDVFLLTAGIARRLK